MSLLHESSESTDHSADVMATRRFRAATIEAALADARAELGHHVEIVDANRIRRGGVGGFFATDLGVELVVRTPGRHDGATIEPEYLDTDLATTIEPEYLHADAAPSIGTLPRSGRRPAESRTLPFYDRAVEEPVDEAGHEPAPEAPGADDLDTGTLTAAGIDRLIASVTAAEQAAHGREIAAAPASFADHLARHLDDRGPLLGARVMRPTSPRPPGADPERSAASRALAPAPAPDADPAPTPGPRVDADRAPTPEPRVAADQVPTPGPRVTADQVPTPEPGVATDQAPTPAPSVDANAAAVRRSRSTPAPTRRRSTGSRDVTRRRIDLAAGAVGRLVEQLSDVQPVAGSRMQDLTRLVVKVTDPDGTVIEIAAELDGDRHG